MSLLSPPLPLRTLSFLSLSTRVLFTISSPFHHTHTHTHTHIHTHARAFIMGGEGRVPPSSDPRDYCGFCCELSSPDELLSCAQCGNSGGCGDAAKGAKEGRRLRAREGEVCGRKASGDFFFRGERGTETE